MEIERDVRIIIIIKSFIFISILYVMYVRQESHTRTGNPGNFSSLKLTNIAVNNNKIING